MKSTTGEAKTDENNLQKAILKFEEWIDRIDAFVVGPGLSKDHLMLETAKRMVEIIAERDLPLVVDGDGIHLLQENPSILSKCKNAVITPNRNEYNRLIQKYVIRLTKNVNDEVSLSKILGNTLVVRKGAVDRIADSSQSTLKLIFSY